MRTRIAVSILVTSLLIAFVYAQSSPGDIHGVVTDVAGGVLPGKAPSFTTTSMREAVRGPKLSRLRRELQGYCH